MKKISVIFVLLTWAVTACAADTEVKNSAVSARPVANPVTGSSEVQPRTYTLVYGEEKKVCRHALQLMKTDWRSTYKSDLFNTLSWKPGGFSIVREPQEGGTIKIGSEFTAFDIDNDGTPETVLRHSSMLSSKNIEFLYIFTKASGLDPGQSPKITKEKYEKVTSINSLYTSTKKNFRLFLETLHPMSFEGQNYLWLDGVFPGDTNERLIVVARYDGPPIRDWAGDISEQLNFVCKIADSKKN